MRSRIVRLINLILVKNKQLIVFLCIGALNNAIGYFIFSMLIFFDFRYEVAILFGTIFSIFFNFFTTGKIVFNNKKTDFFKFSMCYAIICLLNIFTIKVLHEIIFNFYIDAAISTIILAAVSFFASKYFIFNSSAKSFIKV